jgi:transketolase
MRKLFAETLVKYATENSNIMLLTGDLGYKMFDMFKIVLPKQFINCGASEQAMMDIACGLALSGKIPFVYSITPFLLYRSFETIRTYINHERLNVKLVGSGRYDDYEIDGYSHDASDLEKILNCFPNIIEMWPETTDDIEGIVKLSIHNNRPTFISLKR